MAPYVDALIAEMALWREADPRRQGDHRLLRRRHPQLPAAGRDRAHLRRPPPLLPPGARRRDHGRGQPRLSRQRSPGRPAPARLQPPEPGRPVLPGRRAPPPGAHPLGGGGARGLSRRPAGGLREREPGPDLRPARASRSPPGSARWPRPSPCGPSTCRSTPSPWRRARPWPTTSPAAACPRPTPTWPPTCTSGPARRWPPPATSTTKSPTGPCRAIAAATTWSTGATSPTWAWAQAPTPAWAAIASPPSATRRSTSGGGRCRRCSVRRRPRRVPGRPSAPGDVVQVTDARAMAETAILGLRLTEGLSLAAFRRRFGVGLPSVYGPAVAELTALGLLERAQRAPSPHRQGAPAGQRGLRALPAGHVSRQRASSPQNVHPLHAV